MCVSVCVWPDGAGQLAGAVTALGRRRLRVSAAADIDPRRRRSPSADDSWREQDAPGRGDGAVRGKDTQPESWEVRKYGRPGQ